MAIAVAVTKQYWDGKKVHVVGTLTFSGNYATGGDGINFTGLGIKSSLAPYWFEVQGINGFIYAYAPGSPASQTNGKIKVFVEATVATNTPLAEHTAVAYVAGVTGDTVTFYAEFDIR